MYMHIDRVNLPTESSKDDSLESHLQAKSHSCFLHNDHQEKQNSWILVNMSLWSDFTFIAQNEKLLSFCKRMSKSNVYQKAKSSWHTKILPNLNPNYQLFLPYLERDHDYNSSSDMTAGNEAHFLSTWSVQVSLQQPNLCQHHSNCRILHQINARLIKKHQNQTKPIWDGSVSESGNLLTALPAVTGISKLDSCLFCRISEFSDLLQILLILTNHNFQNFQLPFSHCDIAKQKTLWHCQIRYVKHTLLHPKFLSLKAYVSHEICNFACRWWQWCICQASSFLLGWSFFSVLFCLQQHQ